jgi:hypothetical protein
MGLKAIMHKFGHHKVDVLKVDIDGVEDTILNELCDTGFDFSRIGQLLIETHTPKANVAEWTRKLLARGFRMFHRENNVEARGCCREYAFIYNPEQAELRP